MSTISVKEVLNRQWGSELALQSTNQISDEYREGMAGKTLKSRLNPALCEGTGSLVTPAAVALLLFPDTLSRLPDRDSLSMREFSSFTEFPWNLYPNMSHTK